MQYHNLSESEERKLFEETKEGNEKSREILINSHLRVVLKVASGYIDRGISYEDLVGYGNVGLVKAVESFDPERSRFVTYSYWRIRDSIRKALKSRKERIFPTRKVSLLEKVASMQRSGHSLQEISTKIGTNQRYLEILIQTDQKKITLNPRIYDSEVIYAENIKYKDPSSDENLVRYEGIKEELSNYLGPKNLEIIKLRFGLNPIGKFTQDELALNFNMTRQGIEKVEKRAFNKLKKEPIFKELQANY